MENKRCSGLRQGRRPIWEGGEVFWLTKEYLSIGLVGGRRPWCAPPTPPPQGDGGGGEGGEGHEGGRLVPPGDEQEAVQGDLAAPADDGQVGVPGGQQQPPGQVQVQVQVQVQHLWEAHCEAKYGM